MKPGSEKERVNNLLSYDILDSVEEDEYDHLTALVAELTHSPVALVSLIDKDRQWFKSCFGVSIKETPRNISFCAHTIHQSQMLIVEDMLKDERFKDNPLVTNEPHVRFYAGAPLINEEGFCLGTLCIVDFKAKTLTEVEKKHLSSLAKQVMKLLELRKSNVVIKKDYDKIKLLTSIHLEQKEKLEKALMAAEKATLMKSGFVANLSHEIRTPINGISGLLSLLEDSNLNEEQEDYVKTIRNASSTLLYIINDVLDFSKIESGKLDIENINIDFDGEMHYVSKTIKSEAEKKNIGFNFSNHVKLNNYLKGDPYRLKQIIFNLSSNAIKFTNKGAVSLELGGEEKDGKFILKGVFADSGIGMSQDQLDALFTPFTQADSSTTRRFGGTGLGLSIVKELVTLMNGTIEVISQIGVGTKFTFYVPFEITTTSISDQPENVQLSDLNNMPGRKIKVLVAEDNEVNQKVQKAILKKLGYEVKMVNNGREAVEAVRIENFDVILMDMQMPEMDGLTSTRMIRSEQYHTPIIALTANAVKEEKEKCLDAGMNDFVSKPFNTKILNDVILKLVKNKDAA